MENIATFKKAGESTTKFIEGVKPDQWDKISNCAPQTVRDLVNHITSGNLWVKPLIEGKTIAEVGGQFEGDVLGDDPIKAWKDSLAQAIEAFNSEGAGEKIVHLSYGDFPGKSYAGDMSLDNLIHGWDIAVSTKQKDDLPEDVVAVVWDLVQPNLKMFQESGIFGTPVEVPESADLQTQLLGALGRDRSKFSSAA